MVVTIIDERQFMEKQQKKHINDIAEKLILHFRQLDHKQRDDEGEMWQRINAQIEKEQNPYRQRRVRLLYMAVSLIAACTLLLLYFGWGRLYTRSNRNLDEYVNQLADVKEENGQVQLLLSGEKAVCFDKDSVGILYTSKGSLCIDKAATDMDKKEDVLDNEFNQVIVPKGKYMRLTLSDGTQMHVNSGSRVVYPRIFDRHTREIYVEGEVYLDVTPDKTRPFHVKTAQFEVEVLGTSFNVNAHKKNNRGEIVLVEGSVKVYDKHRKEVLLQPDNLVAVCDGEASTVRRVNAKDYTAWINGLLILHDEPLMAVFEKLNRFYDIPIVVAPAIQTEIVDGKLDLRLPLPELIQLISVVVPIECQLNGGTYYISPKNK